MNRIQVGDKLSGSRDGVSDWVIVASDGKTVADGYTVTVMKNKEGGHP